MKTQAETEQSKAKLRPCLLNATIAEDEPMEWQKLGETPEGYFLWTKLDETGREIFKYERTQPRASEGGYYNAESAAKLKNLKQVQPPQQGEPLSPSYQEWFDKESAKEAKQQGEHSPLPWRLTNATAPDRIGQCYEVEVDGLTIALVYPAEEMEANARLIVASVNHADKLLASLEETRDLLIAYARDFPNHFADLDARYGADAVIRRGYTVIEKARAQ